MKPEDIRLMLEIFSFVISGASAVIVVTWKVSRIFDDHQKQTDEKLKGVYRRFDEHKNFIDTFFVRKDLCSQIHVSTNENLKAIVEDMKAIWKEIRDHLLRMREKE